MAGDMGPHNRLQRIENLIVQRLYSLSTDQLRGDLLKALDGFPFRREHLLTMAQRCGGCFEGLNFLLNWPLDF